MLKLILCTLLLISRVSFSASMEFSTHEGVGGNRVIVAKGEIRQGDDKRFESVAQAVPLDGHGYRYLELESPGGSVTAAIALAKEIEKQPTVTIVPGGSTCASACASIVFLSGRLRTIHDDGRLGFHSCLDFESGAVLTACADFLSSRAVELGIEYGSVNAFMAGQGRRDDRQLIYLNQSEANCWGLLRFMEFGWGGEISSPCATSAAAISQLVEERFLAGDEVFISGCRKLAYVENSAYFAWANFIITMKERISSSRGNPGLYAGMIRLGLIECVSAILNQRLLVAEAEAYAAIGDWKFSPAGDGVRLLRAFDYDRDLYVLDIHCKSKSPRAFALRLRRIGSGLQLTRNIKETFLSYSQDGNESHIALAKLEELFFTSIPDVVLTKISNSDEFNINIWNNGENFSTDVSFGDEQRDRLSELKRWCISSF